MLSVDPHDSGRPLQSLLYSHKNMSSLNINDEEIFFYRDDGYSTYHNGVEGLRTPWMVSVLDNAKVVLVAFNVLIAIVMVAMHRLNKLEEAEVKAESTAESESAEKSGRRRTRSSAPAKRCTLLVIAHPDDEAMFFVPLISNEVSNGHTVALICLSDGDYYGLGRVRAKELFASAATLGVERKHCTLVGESDRKKRSSSADTGPFADGDGEHWDATRIRDIVSEEAARVHATRIVTFDSYGVSGHKDHIAVFNALRDASGLCSVDVPCYALESVGIVRKYTGALDALLTLLSASVPDRSMTRLIRWTASPLSTWRAMRAHRSQLVWFRYLFCAFSRYSFINTLRRIDEHDTDTDTDSDADNNEE